MPASIIQFYLCPGVLGSHTFPTDYFTIFVQILSTYALQKNSSEIKW